MHRLASLVIALSTLLFASGCSPDGLAQPGRGAPASTEEVDPRVVVIEREPGADVFVGDDRLTFPAAGSGDIAHVVPGDMVVCGRGKGFLRRVVDITRDDQHVVMLTEGAALSEAVRKGTLSESVALTDAQPLHGDSKGFEYEGIAVGLGNSFVFGKGGVNVTIPEGDVKFSPHFDLDLDIEDASLKYFNAVVNGTIDARMVVDVELDDVVAGGEFEIPLWQREHVFMQMVGWVPVVETVQLSIGVGIKIEGSGTGKARLGATTSASLSAGATFSEGEWQPIGEHFVTFAPLENTWEGDGDFVVRAFVYAEVLVKFYDVAGPAIQVSPYVGASKEIGEPWVPRAGLFGEWRGVFEVPVIDKAWIGFKGHLFDLYKEFGDEEAHEEGDHEHEEGDTHDPAEEEQSACGDISFQGVCEAGVVTWCDEGLLMTADCTKNGWGCGWVGGEIGNDCVEGCGDLDYAGACAGDSVRWCENDEVMTADCAGAELSCGWSGSLYDCL